MTARPLAAAVLLAALLTGCVGGGAPEPTPSPTPTPTPEPPPILAPLTGEVVAAEVTGPVLMAKIDNHPDARPQLGLERADIVFEELVEGGMTRYLGVWHSDIPELLGPVRSIRPMDPAIAAPFGGIIAFSGGQWPFVEAMAAAPVVSAIHGEQDETIFRVDDRFAPHDVMVTGPELVAALDPDGALPAPTPPFAFAEDAATSTAAGGTATTGVDVWFSEGEVRGWQCESAGGWLRSQNGVPDVDAAGQQLQFANVVVLRVEIAMWDGDVPETLLEGSGEAMIFSACGWVSAVWSKAGRDAPIQLALPDGSPVMLAPGSTWVELVPVDQAVIPAS